MTDQTQTAPAPAGGVPLPRPIVLYHGDDFDGICSAAIMLHCRPHHTNLIRDPAPVLLPCNYRQPIPFESIPAASSVLILDFSLSAEATQRLSDNHCHITWIDHHATAIADAAARGYNPPGLRDTHLAACELTWMYLSASWNLCAMPDIVRHLGRYDRWDLADERVLACQYGARSFPGLRSPSSPAWSYLLAGGDNPHLASILKAGAAILGYVHETNRLTLRSSACTADLLMPKPHPFLERGPWRVLAVNTGGTSSLMVEDVPAALPGLDTSSLDAFLFYHRLADGTWACGLRALRPNQDVSLIARAFGGGGHAGASGFTWTLADMPLSNFGPCATPVTAAQ